MNEIENINSNLGGNAMTAEQWKYCFNKEVEKGMDYSKRYECPALTPPPGTTRASRLRDRGHSIACHRLFGLTDVEGYLRREYLNNSEAAK